MKENAWSRNHSEQRRVAVGRPREGISQPGWSERSCCVVAELAVGMEQTSRGISEDKVVHIGVSDVTASLVLMQAPEEENHTQHDRKEQSAVN